MTEMHHTNKQDIEQNEWQTILDAVPCSIAIFGTDKDILFVNKRAIEIFGYDPCAENLEEHMNKINVFDVDSNPLNLKDLPILQSLKHGEIVRKKDLILENANGQRLSLVFNSAPIYDNNGKIIKAVCVFEDFSERVAYEANLLKKEQEYLEIIDSSSEGSFIKDIDKGELHFSYEWKKRLGFEHLTPKEVILALDGAVHPDDLKGKQAVYLQACKQKAPRVKMTFRAKTVDSGYIWIFAQGKIIYNDEGNPVKYLGTHVDITGFKQMQDEIKESRDKYQALIETSFDFIWEIDAQGRFTYCSPSMAKRWGHKPEDMIGMTPFGPMSPDSRKNAQGEFSKNAGAPKSVRNYETTACDGQGNMVYLETSIVPFFDDNNIAKGYRGVSRDITERKEAAKAIQESEQRALSLVEKLKEEDDNKTAFLSTLSHELRNPLAAITLGLSLQEIVSPDDEQAIRAREIVKRQATHLSRLVDDLLDITRINTNKIVLKKEKVELNELVRRVLHDFGESFAQKSIRVTTEYTTPIKLDADPVRLTQAIGNLLSNAEKFTEKEDSVKVKIAIDHVNSEAVITISDTGVGISNELLPDLFIPFTQADNTLDRSKGGLGLGLSIVKGMVELHGGKVIAASEGIGKGAQFTIRLPIPPAKANPERKIYGNIKTSSKALRILIIEDSRDLSEILCAMLEMLGHKTTAAFDGGSGISMAKACQPDVVICDIGLPGINGFDVARTFRNDIELKDKFLIAMSGYAEQDHIYQARESGFDRCLVKPVVLDRLESVLEEVFA